MLATTGGKIQKGNHNSFAKAKEILLHKFLFHAGRRARQRTRDNLRHFPSLPANRPYLQLLLRATSLLYIVLVVVLVYNNTTIRDRDPCCVGVVRSPLQLLLLLLPQLVDNMDDIFTTHPRLSCTVVIAATTTAAARIT